MRQSVLILDALKRFLKHQGMTYKTLAGKVGQSEANIKRIFSQGTVSLDGLEAMCEAAGIELPELVKMSRPEKEAIHSFTQAQETALAKEEKLFVLFYLLLGGAPLSRIVARYKYVDRELEKLLLQLDRLGLVRLHPDNRVQMLASRNIQWLTEGPLNECYKNDIKREFLGSDFSGHGERMRFLNGRLSKQSLQTLSRRIDRVIAEFVEFVEIDRNAKPEETENIWFCLAYRPWTFSVVNRYRR